MMNSNDNDIDRSADELVEMIDKLMQQGGGRVNITADDSSQGIKVSTFISTDCADGKKGACDLQGNEVVPPIYDQLQFLNGVYKYKDANGKWVPVPEAK